MSSADETDTPPAPQAWVRLAGLAGDTDIDRYELTSARRALELVKRKLGRERLLDLLHDEIAAGTEFLRTEVERSAGRETTGTTTLRAQGIGAARFTAWLSRAFGRQDILLAGHPEHYAIHAVGGDVNIVETPGEHVCSFHMRDWDESRTPQADTPPSDGAAQGRRSRMALADGTVVGSVSNSSTEEGGNGFTARLSVTLPATCGPAVIEQHLEHFAVEFRTWILAAAAQH